MTPLLRPAIAAFAGIGALLAAWIAPVSAPPSVGAAAVGPANALTLPAVPPLAQLSETVNRPLFSPTRRPLPGKPASDAPADTAAALFNRYRLQGVVIDGDRRRVLLAPASGGKTLSLAEGDAVDGWTIDRIAPERLTLRSGDRVESVELGAARGR